MTNLIKQFFEKMISGQDIFEIQKNYDDEFQKIDDYLKEHDVYSVVGNEDDHICIG